MTLHNEEEFNKFLSELRDLKDAKKVICKISDEISDFVLLSGEVIGEDTYDKIREIARKHGFQTLANDISIMYRNPKPAFRVE